MTAGYRLNSRQQTILMRLPDQARKNILKSMTSESVDRSRFWLIFAVCGLVGLMCAGARADEIADIYQRLQNDPHNVALNLQYAAAAEKAGKLKWALPAYERALSDSPDNREAQSGIARIRKKLQAEAERP